MYTIERLRGNGKPVLILSCLDFIRCLDCIQLKIGNKINAKPIVSFILVFIAYILTVYARLTRKAILKILNGSSIKNMPD